MTKSDDQTTASEMCPKCGSALAEITVTKSGRKLQRCSKGSWDPETKKNIGCDYVKWFEVEPQELDEKCPKCGAKLVLAFTRFGKKMKKCSTGSWDKEAGCPYICWLKPNEYTQAADSGGEEFLPPPPEE